MHGGKRAGAGRKPISIDLVELEKLCGLQCTDEDMAGFLGVSVRTIERRRRREPSFATAMERGRAKGRISVRRGLHLQASQGKTPALIFLAKNLLGYRDARGNESVPSSDSGAQKPRFEGQFEDLLKLHWETIHADPSAKDAPKTKRSRKRKPGKTRKPRPGRTPQL